MPPLKSSPRKKPRRSQGAKPSKGGPALEWLVSREPAPALVEGGSGTWRPFLTVWMEMPDGLIVGYHLENPERPVTMAGMLEETMASPLVGQPRRPTRIRVADPALATELVGPSLEGVEVVVAPTPEMDRMLHAMEKEFVLTDDPGSYLKNTGIAPDRVEDLFLAARLFHGMAPWRHVGDDFLPRMDIPRLGVRGACVSIIGALSESFGFLIFPSLKASDAFLRAGEKAMRAGQPKGDLGSGFLSLEYLPADQVPPIMRREAMRQGWAMDSPEAFPVLTRVDRRMFQLPLTEQDILVATACADTLGMFVLDVGDRLEKNPLAPVSIDYTDPDDLMVRFTFPPEAYDEFEFPDDPSSAEAPSTTLSRAGRNEACPCGSGKKFKQCCFGKPVA